MSSIIKDGGPAFPGFQQTEGCGAIRYVYGPEGQLHAEHYDPGMTLRDWFAGQALAGFSVGDNAIDCLPDEPIEKAVKRHWSLLAKTAYLAADAMIAAREKGNN